MSKLEILVLTGFVFVSLSTAFAAYPDKNNSDLEISKMAAVELDNLISTVDQTEVIFKDIQKIKDSITSKGIMNAQILASINKISEDAFRLNKRSQQLRYQGESSNGVDEIQISKSYVEGMDINHEVRGLHNQILRIQKVQH